MGRRPVLRSVVIQEAYRGCETDCGEGGLLKGVDNQTWKTSFRTRPMDLGIGTCE